MIVAAPFFGRLRLLWGASRPRMVSPSSVAFITYWTAPSQQPKQPCRRHRIFRDPHTERLERVLDRGDDRAGGGHAAGFADALDAERIERGGELGESHLDPWHLGRARAEVIGEGRGEWLRLFVVAHPFVERVAEPVRRAAEELALDDHRIDDAAAVVDHDVAQDTHAAGLDAPVAQLEVGDARLQEMGGDLERLRAHLRGREVYRGAGGHGLPAGE